MKLLWSSLVVLISVIAYLVVQDQKSHEGRSCRTFQSANIPEKFTNYARDFTSECIRLPKANISLHVLDNKNTKAKQTIFFSHGLLFSTYMWSEALQFFKDDYRVIGFDHRAQGLSEVPPGTDPITPEMNFEDAAELVEILSKKENLVNVNFAGMSMGGFAAMRIGARRPELVKSVILVSTDAETDVNNKKLSNEVLVFLMRFLGYIRVFGKAILPTFFTKPYLEVPENNELWLDYWAINLESTIWRSIRGILDRESFTEVDKIKVPTLIIHGEDDVSLPIKHAKHMSEIIAGSKFVSVPNAGHQSPQESHAVVNEAILSFLKGLQSN